MKKFSPKNFAQVFVRTRNSIEAAIRLGFSPDYAKERAAAMEEDLRVKREVKKLESTQGQSMNEVKSGLSRLAFGRVNDAVALAFDEEPTPEKVAGLDLFNVSEIKRVKGGGVEIKFFDRQKALEKLGEIQSGINGKGEAENLLSAVMERAGGDISTLINDGQEEKSFE